jgi:hypothetical protein
MSESASMTIKATQIGANDYRYTIALKDTGSTPIGTFWFSWVPGSGFLPSAPQFSSPAGWTAVETDGPPPPNGYSVLSDGYSIQFVADTALSALQPGKSVDFTFTSATPPSVMFGKSAIHPPMPVDTSVVYSGSPFSDAGFTLTASSTFEQILQDGRLVETEDFFPGSAQQAFSTLEKDYSAASKLIDSKEFFTGVTGKAYSADEVEFNAHGVKEQATFDLNNGHHEIVGYANDLTFVSLGDDMMTGGGSSEHFVFNTTYGHDVITDFATHDKGAGHDVISLAKTQFANFHALTTAAENSGHNVIITAKDGDTLTLDGLNKATLLTLTADFTFHA